MSGLKYRRSTQAGAGLALKYQTRIKETDGLAYDVLCHIVICNSRKFYSLSSRCQSYKQNCFSSSLAK
jgi:hypothetical protein